MTPLPRVIRPSLKPVYIGYAFMLLLIIAAALAYVFVRPDDPKWPIACLLVLLIFPLRAHLRRRITKMTVESNKLRYETGLFTHSTRTMEIHKVQDVRVDRTLGQRLLGTGDMAIETAGESSRLVMHDIDDPQATADMILQSAHQEQRGSL